MIEKILEFLSANQPGFWAGPILGLIAFVETLFPPFPGDILFVIFAGWAMTGGSSLIVTAAYGVTGCFIASCLLFYIGHSPGRKFVDGWLSRKVSSERIEKARSLVRGYGPLILFGSRFIPGIRSLLVLLAGTSGMKFVLASFPLAISAAAWYMILSFAGRVFGSNLEAVRGFVRQFEIWIWIVLGAVILIFLLFRRLRSSGRRG